MIIRNQIILTLLVFYNNLNLNIKEKNMQIEKKTGFSLIELMVVLVILAILGAATVTGMKQWTANNEIKLALDDLMAGIRKTKVEALKRNLPMQLALTGGGYWEYGCLYVDNAVSSPKYCPTASIQKTGLGADETKNVNLVFNPITSDSIIFSGIGDSILDPTDPTATKMIDITLVSALIPQSYKIKIIGGFASSCKVGDSGC